MILGNWKSLHLPVGERSADGKIEDVWDGSILRELCAPGRFFSNENNLALSLFTDGVPLYKSSKVSLWPVYLVILNLPATIRNNAENVILSALWVGPKKPSMSILLEPVVKSLNSLSTSGLAIKTSTGDVILRTKLVFGVFDLPAKAAVLNAKQFNGEYGCSVCLHPGKRLPNNARVYLPDTMYPERTHAEVKAAAVEAESTRSSVEGILGKSPLTPILDLVESFPIDYMHCVLEGVTKWLMKSWFEPKNHSAPHYIGRYRRQIDSHFCMQRPPNEFSRPPRSIDNHLHYWKASEFKQWLLFYSLPLLLNCLPSLYWHHFALLVCAMHIFLSDSITMAEIDAAEQMLNDFCILLPDLYGESSCTANAHLLTHLAKYVRLWGPLWTHSTFGFESKNGQLKYLFHGKCNITHQLLFNVDVCHTLQQIHYHLTQVESEKVLNYVGALRHTNPRSNMKCINSHTYIVGQQKMAIPTVEQSAALNSNANIEVFYRLYKQGILYSSTSFEKATSKRDNTNCCYEDKTTGCILYGKIELFVALPTTVALVRQLKPSGGSIMSKAGNPCRSQLAVYQQVDLLNSYIVPVTISSSSQLIAIPIDCIISKVIIISTSGNHYCVIQPNKTERH